MRNKQQATNFEELSATELPQVSGGVRGTDDFGLGFYELDGFEHMNWTGGSFRPVSWGEIAGSGKQVYIDGVPIDTDGKLGPRP